MTHGKLTVNVPLDIFIGEDARYKEPDASNFYRMIGERYPWLSDNSMVLLKENARRDLLTMMDEETCGRSGAKALDASGRTVDAIAHIKRFLERNPNEYASWYLLGDLLCKMGDAKGGYEAYSRGRDL